MKSRSLLPILLALAAHNVNACLLSSRNKTNEPHTPAPNLAPMPEAVTSFGAAVLQGRLYVYGGHKGERHEYSAEMVSGSFHCLDLAEGTTWEPLPSSDPEQGAALVAHGSFLYRIGGMAARNHQGNKNDLYSTSSVGRYDVQRRTWSEFTAMPDARSSHDAVVLGDTLFVGGGWKLSGSNNKPEWHDSALALDLGDPAPSWRVIPQPFKRRALAMAALHAKLYFLGGMDVESGTSLEVNIFDPTTGDWSKGPNLSDGPMKGFGCSATCQNGKLLFSGMKGEVFQLSDSGDRWELVGKLQHPRFFHRLVPAGKHHLIAAGGEDSAGKMSTLEVISLIHTP